MLEVQESLSQDNWSNALPRQSVPIEHAAREYQAYPGSQYALPTDAVERQRLLVQHNTLKRLFGNRFLFAPVNLDVNDKVLETGTGPGLWISDLAKSVDPSVPMVAVDIESRLFPASPPKNIEFRVESVIKLPLDWTGAFSLVHQRLLMLALQHHEWTATLNEMYRVLRPGGWVQLAEYTPWRAGKYPGQPCMERLVALYRCVTTSRNLYVDCADHLPTMLKQAGFVDIRTESRMQLIGKLHGEAGVASNLTHRGVFNGMKTPVLEAGGFGYVSSEAEYDELVECLEKEWDEVPGAEKEFIILWARKPSA
ncbi:S-adenosyl-L-methionine-dependent methyltransferase [Mycena maculata]|uniref:S-adenosyl-L-methionine-dependent methyltransferase n=1 Tax=Mycena maculata TaxID=230809 RepID=A0AAD7MG03_9AGAR|nr:S-adenosyl-L-methionine-dependent methyltransferase [Mycena maculata]